MTASLNVEAPGKPAPGRTITGWHVLAGMIAFFGVVVGVNLWLAVSASRTWTGLVVANSYVASQEFNGKERLAREQAALGWHAVLTYRPGRLALDLRDGSGRPVPLGQVSVDLTRPLGDREDRTVTLLPAADGSYFADIELPHGVWNAFTHAAETPHGAFEQHSRLMAP